MTPRGLSSASALQTPMVCPGAHSLPQVGFASEAGDDGQDRHALLNLALDTRKPGGDLADSAFREYMTTPVAAKWLGAVLDGVENRLDNAAQEVAYSYDPRTGIARCHGAHIGRNYPDKLTETEIRGTADYVLELAPGSWLVVDLKTGLAEMPRASRLWQLKVLALAVGAWHNATTVQTAILHAPRDGQRPWWEWGPTYDALELVALRAELLRGSERILQAQRDVARGQTPRLVQGPHCATCSARLVCPAQTALVRRMGNSLEDVKRDFTQLLDVETAGVAWARLQAAKAVLSELERQIYAFASVQPVPLPDGRVLGKHRKKSRAEIDADKAHAWLTTTLGAGVADAAMERNTSKTRLLAAVEAAAKRGTRAEVGRQAWAQLVVAGIATERWTESVGPYEPTDETIKGATSALPAETVKPPALSTPVFHEDKGPGETA